MKKLYFIRHGESVGNFQRVFSGRADHPLTELGRQQAKTAAQKAGGMELDCIVTSPLIRAKETAEIIAREIDYPAEKIVVSELFAERSYGDLQGQPYIEADGVDFDTVANAETSEHLRDRAKAAVEFLIELDADNILVSSHGTFGRALRQQLLHQTGEAIEVPIEQELLNAQIIRWI